jgi:H+/Cl- antiporter ClcA
MLPAEFVSEIFARVRETIFRYSQRLTATDVLILVIAALILLAVYEVLGNNIDLLASGFDGSLTAP